MRADRLLALLMLLQARGRQTARDLAAALEVSERTIYRDVEALSQSGVPVYAERGPGGGVALLDSYRTTLTGLTDPELRALFMLTIPAPLAELGISQELKAALLKLTAALPAARRHHEALTRQRIYLDPAPWQQPERPAPHLHTLYQAAWEDRRVWLTCRYPAFVGGDYTRRVDVYGLVAKAGAWYVVVGGEEPGQGARVVRVADVIDARLDDTPFTRPPDFDLAACWEAWRAAVETHRPVYPVTLRVDPALLPYLRGMFGAQVDAASAEGDPPDASGWRTVTLAFESLPEARSVVLGFGRAVEVIEPAALRLSVIDYARQIAAFYAEREGDE